MEFGRLLREDGRALGMAEPWGADAARTSPGVLSGRRRARLGFDEHSAIRRLLTSKLAFWSFVKWDVNAPQSRPRPQTVSDASFKRLSAATES
jgi:hypothetical protein